MRPLMLDDLLPLEEFAGRRREFFDSLDRYLDRYRRVRVGPRLTLVFENRQTLWFRIQELLRITRLSDPARVQQELDLYNRLLPARNQLQAALLFDIAEETLLVQELKTWRDFRGETLCFVVGDERCPATVVTSRPEDYLVGAAHWVEFGISERARKLLPQLQLPAHFQIKHPGYEHGSPPLSEEVRQSLLDDLELSDRDQ